MGITSMEIKEYQLRRSFIGYDRKDVEALRELSIEALTGASREISRLQEELKTAMLKLSEHEKREAVLKDTITLAQKMVEEVKGNARKEAELLVAEALNQSDEITRQAQKRVAEIQEEIFTLKKQRKEFETSLKALLEYHTGILALEEKETMRLDDEAEKLKFIRR